MVITIAKTFRIGRYSHNGTCLIRNLFLSTKKKLKLAVVSERLLIIIRCHRCRIFYDIKRQLHPSINSPSLTHSYKKYIAVFKKHPNTQEMEALGAATLVFL